MIDYLTRLLGAVSRLLNVLLLNGSPSESMSGRSYRCGWRSEKWFDLLFWFDPNHCENAYWFDVNRADWVLNNVVER